MKDSFIRYNFLDVTKFVMAILILSAHYASEIADFPTKIDYFFSIYIIAVPFFFTASGFLLFRNYSTTSDFSNLFKKYIIRIIKVYIVWSIIYLLFILIDWSKNGVTLNEVSKYIHMALVFSTYPTIWFLPSLLVAVTIVYFAKKRFSTFQIFVVSIILYIVGVLGYSYSFVLDEFPLLKNIYLVYNQIFITTRNGIFNGFIYVTIGLIIAEKKNFLSNRLLLIISFILLASLTVEAFILKLFFSNIGADTLILLVPFTYFFFQWVLSINFSNSNIYVKLSKMSMIIFLSQRIFLTALPAIFPSLLHFYQIAGPYFGLLVFVVFMVLLSMLILKYENRIRLFKYLY